MPDLEQSVFDDFADAQDLVVWLVDVGDAFEDVYDLAERVGLVHLTLLSEVVAQDGAVVDADWQLFTDALAEHHDAQDAWVLGVTVLLQDVRMVFY